jgi:hypothetical protein
MYHLPFAVVIVVAMQKYRLEPRKKMDLVVQRSRFFTKPESHVLKQVVRIVFGRTLLQAQFVYSIGIFFPYSPNPIRSAVTKDFLRRHKPFPTFSTSFSGN